MKKTISVLMGIVMAFSLAACSNSAPDTTSAPESSETAVVESPDSVEAEPTEAVSTEEESTDAETEGTEETEEAVSAEAGNAVVVYYSATGSTEQVANVIAEYTGADLFELEPVEPYTSADLRWTDDNSRVSREHDNPEQRDVELVSDTVENWDLVSTVYVGYPIWWGIAAWPMDSFIEANDFTGKTVIPFCTSASSGLGESGELLAEMAGTGDWLEGVRFGSNVSEEDVQAWIDSLGL